MRARNRSRVAGRRRPGTARPGDRRFLFARPIGGWTSSILQGATFSKKNWRKIVGLLRPIRCPYDRQYTRQIKQAGTARKCLSCGAIFTRAESRAAFVKGERPRVW